MMDDKTLFAPAIKREMVSAIPKLRAFAVSLCGNQDRADDLVQETLARGLLNIASFTPGTNLLAWVTAAAQDDHMDLLDFQRALQKLPPDQREALILIGASGLSYEEAAEICDCAIGTIKSRLSRARQKLGEMLDVEPTAAE
jgi:RNA polymerase sigma-70 factor, ECF subfamily